MEYTYRTKGTCSRSIRFEVEDGRVKNVRFEGGCNGNLKGIAALVEGMKPEEVIERVEGIRCGFKNTSCPDQLAKALREVEENG
ncbi:MAG: TIGR03905 family TSCPD domain-containing protein [Clostridia bacterium]|nr:TIGR03905 family TSCPD domain-containing protein [Clostridia bacterium]MBQ3007524.1 TIGR03905 family TSCPD domain-containing protein [Clostridia bacterium]